MGYWSARRSESLNRKDSECKDFGYVMVMLNITSGYVSSKERVFLPSFSQAPSYSLSLSLSLTHTHTHTQTQTHTHTHHNLSTQKCVEGANTIDMQGQKQPIEGESREQNEG